jgi:hypothetical protein
LNDDGGGAGRDGLTDEVVSVDVEAGDGDEEAARLDAPRVVGDAGDVDAGGVLVGCGIDGSDETG